MHQLELSESSYLTLLTDWPKNKLILIYWKYVSDIAHESNDPLPNLTNNVCFLCKSNARFYQLYHTHTKYLIVEKPFVGFLPIKHRRIKEIKSWSCQEHKWSEGRMNKYKEANIRRATNIIVTANLKYYLYSFYLHKSL